ncbi:unnamed protein product [Acanthoscelides obtectus]|uniref:Uncharacterized protein n=1 Tax=Acanthoscelides obtectus TaxID=200917 RepID=A0A9P0KZS7_ACAOB|nr:unnamed protein product [Acanthoscelides obtectus]CAK1638359.1 hypothetical protein AOBTE_LOCUS10560 [Acanthoscelides obtectus]
MRVFIVRMLSYRQRNRMACHNVIVFFTVLFLWLIYASAQRSVELFDSRGGEFYPGNKGSVAFLHQPLRVQRKIAQRAFQNMDLSVARSFGKRDCYGKDCVKREPQFSGARLYGKRNTNNRQFKCFFMDCTELQRLDASLRRTDMLSEKLRRAGSNNALLSDD